MSTKSKTQKKAAKAAAKSPSTKAARDLAADHAGTDADIQDRVKAIHKGRREKSESEPVTQSDGLCVFAIRLAPDERDLIHKAAGPGKATKFVRGLAVAAARNDEAAVKAIMKAAHANA